MSDFDYDIFGDGTPEEPEKVEKVVPEKPKKAAPKKVSVTPKKATVKPSTPTVESTDSTYNVFDGDATSTEPQEASVFGETKEQSDTSAYNVFTDKTENNSEESYYSSSDGGYQDEGGSGNRRNRAIDTGEAAGLAVAAVAGAAISKSNKVPKAIKNAINPNYQNEKRKAEEQQMISMRQAQQERFAQKSKAFANGQKTPFYKKWWFWLIIGLLLLGMIVGSCGGDDETSTDSATTSTTSATSTTTTTEPSTVAKVYSVPAGAKVEEINGKWGLYENGTLVEGYTGIASNSFGDWYIVNGLVDFGYNGIIKDGSKEYQVDKGKAVEYSNGTTAAPPLSPAEYKARCQTKSYEELARNPDNHKGEYVKFYGQVLQVQNQTLLGVDLNSVVLRVATKDSGYGNWYDDVVYVTYTKKAGESNILEDDFVTLYGIYDGTTTYETIMGGQVTIPSVDAEYIDIA